MGWKASFSVRVSGLEDGTLTDVLEAVAVFVDDRDLTSECYPALTSIMTIARKSRNVVRAALKELVSQGLLSFRQENGEKRYYRVHLNLLPPSKIAGFRSEPGDEVTPVQKCTGFRSEPGSEVNGERVQKCTPTGFRSEPGPGSEVNPEMRMNRELNREEEKIRNADTREGTKNWTVENADEECEPLEEPQPLNVCELNPLRKVKGTPLGKLRGPLEEPQPEQGIEQGIEQGRVAHASRSLPRATHTREDVVEKKFDCEHADEEDDDKQSAQPVIPEEPPFDAGLFDEAQLVASGNLESFENEVNAEVVFSPDAQIPIENIEILNATASDSIFCTDTPPKDQNAAERKSEAISKPKRKRVSSSVVKDKPEDISQEVWDDWLTTRRAKRLPLTQTALNSVRREAASAGLTFQAAVTFAVEQGWAAFRAEWYRNATRKGDSTKTNARYLTAQERYEERMRKAGEMSDEEYFAQFDLPEEILNYEKAQEAKRHVAS